MNSKKIVIFSRAYQNMAGGVEKMSLDLARGLSERGHSVVIISLDKESDTPFFEWPAAVSWIRIGIGNPDRRATILSRFRRLKAIRVIAKDIRPDFGIGFQVGSFALLRLATLGLGIKTIAAERNSPDLFNFIKRGEIKRLLSNIILLSSTRIAVQFESYKFKYPVWLRPRIVYTPNWVTNISAGETRKNTSTFQIVFVGRLTFQKNVSVLLDAIKLLPDFFEIKIVGDGPDLENLKAKSTKLKQKIIFLAPQLDLSDVYNSANVLCLPSRWEGFPNVVAEALAHGLPVVGFESCSGIPELIVDGSNGVIASGMDDAASLANALLKASKTQFSTNIVKESVKKFDFPNFVQKWEDSFEV
jgi:glycosyltransferase involved in cell wall biosynthesis